MRPVLHRPARDQTWARDSADPNHLTADKRPRPAPARAKHAYSTYRNVWLRPQLPLRQLCDVGGQVVTHLPSTVVRIISDDGVEGFGEVCPLGPLYLASHGDGARAAITEMMPGLIDLDPRNLNAVHAAMNRRPAVTPMPRVPLISPAGTC